MYHGVSWIFIPIRTGKYCMFPACLRQLAEFITQQRERNTVRRNRWWSFPLFFTKGIISFHMFNIGHINVTHQETRCQFSYPWLAFLYAVSVVCNVTHRYNYDIRKGLSSDVHEESREILELWKQSESNLW